ncbi:hypothetical protein ACFE04_020588 [Oxalis oulophora]
MAGGGGTAAANVLNGEKAYPGNLTWYVIITSIVGAMGGLIFGYDIGISGGVTSMNSFLIKFFPSVYVSKNNHSSSTNQYCQYNNSKLTMFTSSLYLAALVSSVFASWITRKYGRKKTMLGGGFLFLLGAILNGVAQNVGYLIGGRILLGVGIGFSNQAVPLYLSEMAPYKHRGALNIGFQMMITIGILIANVLNFFFAKINGGWRWSLGLACVPALFVTVGSCFLSETPNSLIERGQNDIAKEKLKRIRGVEDVDEEFLDIVHASEESRKVNDPWSNLLKRKYRPQLIMSVFLPFLQQFTGINVIMFYAPVLFNTLGFKDNASLMSAVITGLVNVMATIVSIVAVDRVGRRKLFLQGGIQMFMSQIVIGICIAAKFGTSGNPGELPALYAVAVVVLICVYVAGFAWSWGPLAWLVPSEIFPLEIRPAAQSITVAVNMLATFVVAQVFLLALCHMKFGLFFFFAAFVFAMSWFIYLLLPETKGIPIEEMENVWREHWYWKRFIVEENVA